MSTEKNAYRHKQLNYMSKKEFEVLSDLLDETSRILSGLHKSKSQYSQLNTHI